jgi:bacillithiol system protein YtxJ
MKKIVILNNKNEWEQLLQESGSLSEIIVFKFSPYCGTSSSCEQLFDRWFSGIDDELNIICAKIDVISARPLSQYIAAEYNIKHESPQVIWFDKMRNIKWHESHYSITVSALTGLLN